MLSRLICRFIPVLAVVAIFAGSIFAAKNPVPQVKPVKPIPPQKNPVLEAAKAEIKLEEADVLRHAYVLLATANADYKGHKGHAMGQVQSAVKILDSGVLKNGTVAQKQKTLIDDSAVAKAKIVDKYVKVPKGVKEPQVISDLQLKAAAQLLANVRGAFIKNNQAKVLGHVDQAIKEIAVALTIR